MNDLFGLYNYPRIGLTKHDRSWPSCKESPLPQKNAFIASLRARDKKRHSKKA